MKKKPTNSREMLLHIIQTKGSCEWCTNEYCPIYSTCKALCTDSIMPLNKRISLTGVYDILFKEAFTQYKIQYGLENLKKDMVEYLV